MIRNYRDEYIKYREQYLKLKSENINLQKGGGAWGYYSYDNDSTLDLIGTYGFSKYDEESGEFIFIRDKQIVNKALDQMFKEFDKYIRHKDKKTKNPDFSPYNLNYEYLGVIVYLIIYLFEIPKQYLYRVLAHAYKNYFKMIRLGESTTWREPEDRIQGLLSEILLINYAINYGTPINVPAKLFLKINEKVDMDKLSKYLKNQYKTNKLDLLDYKYIIYKKIRPKYKFLKYEVFPPIDPNLLDEGVVMDGYNGVKQKEFYIISSNNGKLVWTRFDHYESPSCVYLASEKIYDIYGKKLDKIYKRKM